MDLSELEKLSRCGYMQEANIDETEKTDKFIIPSISFLCFITV